MIRYYSYNEYEPDSDEYVVVITKSENEIREEYWPWWYNKMCEKFTKEHVDATYNFEDCLEDWAIVHLAWEVKE